MKYKNLKNLKQKMIDDFPIAWAFNDQQFEEGMKKLGAESKKDLLSIGAGGFIHRKSKHDFVVLLDRMSKIGDRFLKNEKNLLDAFKYELANHEYCITFDETQALEALGLTMDGLSELQKAILQQAKVEYLEQYQPIEVSYVGIDGWNRPVFKDDKGNFYGNTDKLFSIGHELTDAEKKDALQGLTFFGRKFGCEPMGTPIKRNIILI